MGKSTLNSKLVSSENNHQMLTDNEMTINKTY